MKPEKVLEAAYEAMWLQRVCGVAPKDFPNLRELRIQSAKLKRQIENPPWGKGGLRKILVGGTLFQQKKRAGKHHMKVALQHRKVHLMAEKSFKEYLRRARPALTNAQFREWKLRHYLGGPAKLEQFKKRVLPMLAK